MAKQTKADIQAEIESFGVTPHADADQQEAQLASLRADLEARRANGEDVAALYPKNDAAKGEVV